MLLLLLLLEQLAMKGLSWVCVKMAKHYYFRKLGMLIYAPDRKIVFKEGFLRLMMETYFELAMITMISFVSFREVPHLSEVFKGYDMLSSGSTMLALLVVVAYPIWAANTIIT